MAEQKTQEVVAPVQETSKPVQEESNDTPYVLLVGKRVRAYKKKVGHIEEIEKKAASGGKIDEKQKKVLANKEATVKSLQEFQSLRDSLRKIQIEEEQRQRKSHARSIISLLQSIQYFQNPTNRSKFIGQGSIGSDADFDRLASLSNAIFSAQSSFLEGLEVSTGLAEKFLAQSDELFQGASYKLLAKQVEEVVTPPKQESVPEKQEEKKEEEEPKTESKTAEPKTSSTDLTTSTPETNATNTEPTNTTTSSNAPAEQEKEVPTPQQQPEQQAHQEQNQEEGEGQEQGEGEENGFERRPGNERGRRPYRGRGRGGRGRGNRGGYNNNYYNNNSGYNNSGNYQERQEREGGSERGRRPFRKYNERPKSNTNNSGSPQANRNQQQRTN